MGQHQLNLWQSSKNRAVSGCGGIGIRARSRSWFSQGSGGSNPLDRIKTMNITEICVDCKQEFERINSSIVHYRCPSCQSQFRIEESDGKYSATREFWMNKWRLAQFDLEFERTIRKV